MKRLNIREAMQLAPNDGAGIESIFMWIWSLADGLVREAKSAKYIVHESEEEAGSFLSFCALCWNVHVWSLLLYKILLN